MPQAMLKVDFVNPVKPGKKLADFKCGDTYYKFAPEKFFFEKGSTYNVTYSEKDYNGKPWFLVESVKGNDPQNHHTAPAAPAANGNGHRPSMSPEDNERITRLAIAKSCLEGGHNDTRIADQWLAWVKGQVRPTPQTHDSTEPF